MEAGQLFVNLGVKGADKSVGQITGMSKGMQGLASTGWETKAAIVGAFYAFEQLISSSSKLGTGLTNFEALTGMSTKSVQQWDYQMRLAGGTTEEMQTNLANIQKSMAQIQMGGAPPKWFFQMAQLIGEPDLLEHKGNTGYMAQAYIRGLKKAGQSPEAKAIVNTFARSLGLSDNLISGGRLGKFDQERLDRAPVLSDPEIKQLYRVNQMWQALSVTIEQTMQKFVAHHGADLVKDVGMVVTQFLRLAIAIQKLADKMGLLPGIAKELGIVTDTIGAVTGDEKAQASLSKGASHLGQALWWQLGEFIKPGRTARAQEESMKKNPITPEEAEQTRRAILGLFISNGLTDAYLGKGGSVVPQVNKLPAHNNQQGNNNVTVHQVFTGDNPGSDPNKILHVQKKAIKEVHKATFRKIPNTGT